MHQMDSDFVIDNQPYIINLSEIKEAASRIQSGIIHTPLCEAKLSKHMDYDIYLKCENLQYTGSCAERGVRNAMLVYGEEARSRGMIVPSLGDTALAAAYHGKLLGVPVTVVLTERAAAPVLAQRCAELGADVVICGDSLDSATAYADKAREESGQILLNYDDPLMLCGLGSVGLEIVSQLPDTEAVLVPAGGALLAAVLHAVKKLKCSCLVYGAESAKVPKILKALQTGQPVPVPVAPSLADELSCSTVGVNAFVNLKGKLDRMLVVDESYIARAALAVLERERLVAAGAGVCALAALMQGLAPELRGKRVVCVLSSGNIEGGRLCRVIQRGLCADGRLLRCAVPLSDQRDALTQLSRLVERDSAVLKSLVTEQVWMHSDVATTWANVVLETANEEHATTIKDHLRSIYPAARFAINDFVR